MTRTILVAYDPGTRDIAPVRFGQAAARFTGAPLTVVAVYEGGMLEDRLASGTFGEELSADAREALDDLKATLEGEGEASPRMILAESHSAARGLHRAMDEETSGLVVLGSTGRGAVGRVLPGSTAERVVHGAPCPVAVVPRGYTAPEGGLRTIAVGFADSDEGRAALRVAAAVARARGARLRVVTALRHGPVQTYSVRDEAGRELLAAGEALDRACAELAEGTECETEVAHGDAAEALVGVSQSADLVVVGSRAYGPLRAVALGGVSRRVMAEAHCPVLVLPRGAEADLEELLPAAGATA